MNIRKFIGATSREALRFAREALGADAAILSNRTLDDGSVEIVALADAELAAVAAPATRMTSGSMPSAFSASALPRESEAEAAAHGSADEAGGSPGAMQGAGVHAAPATMGNPYAGGGMPDVFSSVFGASVEASRPAAKPAPGAANARGTAPAEPRTAAAERQPGNALDLSGQPGAAASAKASSPAMANAAADAGSATPAPWLVEQAKRLMQQRDDLIARAQAPAAAHTPEWARGVVQDVVQDVVRRLPSETAAPAQPSPAAAAASASATAELVRASVERVVSETVMHELSALRGLMEEQFAGLLWNQRQRRSPAAGALSKRLFAAGFSAQLVQQVVEHLPEGADSSLDAALEWTQTTLAANLPVLESEDALMERGGVFALMGPTGVGKTTTTAKLAARCVMRFGASKVALLTTDSYRIGGHEQLRIYGRILGVPVHAVKDTGDLQLALTELRNKHVVLIDTIGMSQRDRAVPEQIAMLHGTDLPVQRLLLLNATNHGDTLNEVVRAYSATDQPALAGCILTKLDEATQLGGALDTVIRNQLPVHYVSTGQKVPENLYVATKRFLLKSAFCAPRDDSPFVPQEEEMPGLLAALAARAGCKPGAEAAEVRLG